MYAKIRINGDILVKTGMHIGGSSAFAAIGAVDSPIVRDVRSNLPLLPGSSLKGKMRSLLAKEFNESLQDPDNDHERIVRLFGSAKKGNVKRSRLLFSDMVLANEGELRRAGLQSMTEALAEGMRLLQYDYIGGSGSRGYGKIAFENIIAETVVGEVSEELLAQCNKILSQAIQE